MKRFITTPIYYVNDKPHIGHVYTTTLCDIYARWMRENNQNVFFLTGTDEHGQKIEKHAHKLNIKPKELADAVSKTFQDAMKVFNLSNDYFIRTTDSKHIKQVQSFVKKLKEKGLIYLGEFEGWYDASQEEYYTETKAKSCNYISPITGRNLEKASQKNYYFKLSHFQNALEEHYKSNTNFVRPSTRKNEILNRIRDGLQDIPISRTNFSWGIPMPDNSEHVIYVWIDALFNYATALDLTNTNSTKHKYWPADYHIVGKEILWFHSVIWPALLMGLELEMPKCIYAHSFWISNGQKMSKSLGNFVDLNKLHEIIEIYGLDALRWYLATQGPLESTDANFTMEHFNETYEADLVNTVGNCASRVTAMVEKYLKDTSPEKSDTIIENYNWPKIINEIQIKAHAYIEDFNLHAAANISISLIRKLDSFINTTQPFKLAKDLSQKEKLNTILYQCLEVLRISAHLLKPWMPDKMNTLINELENTKSSNSKEWGQINFHNQIKKIGLFPRIK